VDRDQQSTRKFNGRSLGTTHAEGPFARMLLDDSFAADSPTVATSGPLHAFVAVVARPRIDPAVTALPPHTDP